MKKIKLGSKKTKLVVAALVVLAGAQGVYTYGVAKDNKEKTGNIIKLKSELDKGSKEVKSLQKLLDDAEKSFKNKSNETKELQDKLNKEKENMEKIKSELDDALAKKQQRLDKQYASNSDTQEVAQSSLNSSEGNNSTPVAKNMSAGGKSFTVEATAYDGYAMGGMTASGVRINSQGDRVIAVDPSIIPLGSRVYVEGYGEAVAADTGGAIQGHIIDLNMSEAEAVQWGRRPVNITVLD